MNVVMGARALVLPSMCDVQFQSRTRIPVLPSFCYVLMYIVMDTLWIQFP